MTYNLIITALLFFAVYQGGLVALAAIIILIILPPAWDPAIRLKEWMMKDKGNG